MRTDTPLLSAPVPWLLAIATITSACASESEHENNFSPDGTWTAGLTPQTGDCDFTLIGDYFPVELYVTVNGAHVESTGVYSIGNAPQTTATIDCTHDKCLLLAQLEDPANKWFGAVSIELALTVGDMDFIHGSAKFSAPSFCHGVLYASGSRSRDSPGDDDH
jgi:hypothetical protein